MIILGLGTGRCGTTSLSRLLSRCNGVEVTHERAPQHHWGDDSPGHHFEWIDRQYDGTGIWGDVALFHLWPAPFVLKHYKESVCPVVMRTCADTTDSFVRTCKGYITGKGSGRKYMPSWEDMTEHEAFHAYWHAYYDKVLDLQAKYPHRVRIFSTTQMNSDRGQEAIFDFCRVPESDRVYGGKCRENATRI